MERGSFSPDELPRTTPEQTDKLIDESDVLAHQALSRILELIKEAENESDSTK
jgi:hypothetical protein